MPRTNHLGDLSPSQVILRDAKYDNDYADMIPSGASCWRSHVPSTIDMAKMSTLARQLIAKIHKAMYWEAVELESTSKPWWREC